MEIPVSFVKKPVGLGDAVAKATEALGVKQCGGCKKRQEALNKALTVTPTAPGPINARLQAHIDMLPTRTVADLRSLHVIVTDQEAWCLDLNLRAPTLKELHRACLERVESMQPGEVLPAAPIEDWMNTIPMRLIKHYWLLTSLPVERIGVSVLREREG